MSDLDDAASLKIVCERMSGDHRWPRVWDQRRQVVCGAAALYVRDSGIDSAPSGNWL